MILSLIGAEPDKVSAVGSYHLHSLVADATTIHLEFSSGERAHIFVSWLHPFKEQKLVVIGTEGMVVLDDGHPWNRKLVLYPHRMTWQDDMPLPIAAEPVPVVLRVAEPLRLECLHFLDCVRTGARPRTDGGESLRVAPRVLTRASEALAAARGDGGANGTQAIPERRVAQRRPGVMIHEFAYVDARVQIGEGTKILAFQPYPERRDARPSRQCRSERGHRSAGHDRQ